MKMDDYEIKKYLDTAIDYWRGSKEDYAKYYVDAFLSVHMTIFGYYVDKSGNKIFR